jgi:1,4-alpha-glucan branching enzyme
VLRQTGRELLLLESSDWQFLISTWSARDYAELRFTNHWEVIKRLFDLVRRLAAEESLAPEDWAFVEECEQKDLLFPDIDPNWWRARIS